MVRRPLRIATTSQLEPAVREAGFEAHRLPEEVDVDFNRSLERRIADGDVYRPFLEKNNIDLVLDFNTGALTFVPSPVAAGEMALTTAVLGIPHVSFYVDPVTSTMSQVAWPNHWHLLESSSWIKGIWDTSHAEELTRLGIPNAIAAPMGINCETFDTTPNPEPDPGPVIAFMGHPASSWFRSEQPVAPRTMFPGFVAAAVHSGMPDVAFHKIYYDLYELGDPIQPGDDDGTRARKSLQYFRDKFTYNAFLAVQQRDRWVRFLKNKLGDQFEIIGDHWGETYGLKHTPRIWDMKELHRRMRHVPICLNLLKGNVESSVILRHFEITAHGGFMMTYPTPELPQFFEIGKECVVFYDEADLLEKISYYLSHSEERYEIAAAGQRRTLAEHRLSHRIIKLVEAMRESNALGGAAQPSSGDPGQVTIHVDGAGPAKVPAGV